MRLNDEEEHSPLGILFSVLKGFSSKYFLFHLVSMKGADRQPLPPRRIAAQQPLEKLPAYTAHPRASV